MKEATIYVAFDGSTFERKQDCIDHEKAIKEHGIDELYVKIQQAKAGRGCSYSLYNAFDHYIKAKNSYLETCVKKFPEKVRAERLFKYMERKAIYNRDLREFELLRRKVKELKKMLSENE